MTFGFSALRRPSAGCTAESFYLFFWEISSIRLPRLFSGCGGAKFEFL